METLIQRATRNNQEKYQQEQGKLGPFVGSVVSVNPIKDELGMSFGPTPERTMPVQHPFVGPTSWIRSMPEKGTVFLMQNRFDSGQPEAIKTIPTFSRTKVEEYERGLNVYRPLQSGEHDVVSSGFAFAYFSRRGNLDLRSGAAVKLQLNREQQDLTQRAPTHRTELLFNEAGKMGDEERLGVVKRWKSAAEEIFVKKNEKFTAEHYLQLRNPAKSGPAILFKRIEGHVFDDRGQEIKHTTTAIPLRSQLLWYTTTDEFTKQEIDQNGNMLLSFPSTATTGLEFLISEGGFRQVIGKNLDININKDKRVVVQQNVNYKVGQNTVWDSGKKLSLKSPKLAIGDGSTELLKELADLIDKLGQVKVLTPVGPAAPMTASPEWSGVMSVQSKIKSITGSF